MNANFFKRTLLTLLLGAGTQMTHAMNNTMQEINRNKDSLSYEKSVHAILTHLLNHNDTYAILPEDQIWRLNNPDFDSDTNTFVFILDRFRRENDKAGVADQLFFALPDDKKRLEKFRAACMYYAQVHDEYIRFIQSIHAPAKVAVPVNIAPRSLTLPAHSQQPIEQWKQWNCDVTNITEDEIFITISENK
jgi:hypothetical protein